jgi:cyclophilin family peptidyl-prolyl cis-trans isomerase
MGTEKRQRQKEGRQSRLAAQQAARQAAARRNRIIAVVLVTFVVFGALVLLSGRGADDGDTEAAGRTDETADDDEAPDEAGEPREFAYGSGECPPDDGADERRTEFDDAPQQCIDPDTDYQAVITTTLGEFTVDLDQDRAPGTVNNFVVLARWGYYDGVSFHRIIPGFVVQGGDATGQPPGTGGPGYQIMDELPAEGEYREGSVAMANSGPDTNGSQFFVVTDGADALQPLYSLFGEVVEGMDVVRALEEVGTPAGTPSEDVGIESVRIIEG